MLNAPFWPADDAVRAGISRRAEWSKVNVARGFTMPG